jgi:hypothetical protein
MPYLKITPTEIINLRCGFSNHGRFIFLSHLDHLVCHGSRGHNSPSFQRLKERVYTNRFRNGTNWATLDLLRSTITPSSMAAANKISHRFDPSSLVYGAISLFAIILIVLVLKAAWRDSSRDPRNG